MFGYRNLGFGAFPNRGVFTIEGSGSFNATDGKLTRTISDAGNRRTFILEVIIKRGGSQSSFLTAYSSGSDTFYFYLSGGQVYVQNYISANQIELKTDARLRDFSAWTHLIVAVDTTQGTEANRVKAWSNGVELAWASSPGTYPTQNFETKWNTGSQEHQIGHSSTTYSSDYFARAASYDGQTMTDPVTDGFGEFDSNGVWVPLNVSGKNFGTTGFLIEGGAAFTNGTDSSGNSQNFTKGGTITNVKDTLTDKALDDFGNYCTWNSACAFPSSKVTLSNGSTQAVITADGAILGTQFFDVTDSDGFYWETKVTANIGNATHIGIGQQTVPLNNTSYLNNGIASYLNDGGADHTSGARHSSGTFPTYTNNDVIGVAVKGGAIWFSKNNTWINGASAAEISAGTTTNAVFTGLTGMWTSMVREHNGTNTTSTTNWGASAFAYTPPTGLKRLMTADRSAPTVTNPSDLFNTVLYTGNGSSRTISGVGFQPDWVWIKDRNVGENHYSFDAVRGAEKRLHQNTSDAEATESTALTGFVSDGFTLGDGSAGANTNTRTYVAWCWKAGGSGSSDATGGITVTRSTASHQGFSICKGTSGTGTQNFAHGLGAKPEFVILRDLEDGSQNWQVQHKDVNANMKDITTLSINRNNAAGSSSNWWGAEPTSTLQYFYTNQVTGTNDFVCYLFRRISGLIGIGKYAGNGSTDGPFVQVDDGGSGFMPAWVMIKNITSAGNWFIYDNQRNPFNVTNAYLIADGSATEATSGPVELDFVANGFKLRSTNDGTNGGSDSYVYLAFAEHPFGGDGVTQAKARP